MTSNHEQGGDDLGRAKPGRAAKLIKQRFEAAQPTPGLQRPMGRAYEAAFEAVFSVLIGVGLGYWADERFGSSPIGIGIGAVVGFAAMVVRLMRLGKAMERESEKATPVDSDQDQREQDAQE